MAADARFPFLSPIDSQPVLNMANEDEMLEVYLREQGCSDEEIRQILGKLRQHDDVTFRDSVFDSIESGSFNLKALIEDTKDEDD